MKVLKTTFVLAALGFALSAGQAWAQATPPAQPPATPPAQPPATAKPPATPPASQKPAEPAAQPKPPVPFPEGAKIAYVDYQFVAATADEGKAATARIQALQKKKNDELTDRNKKLQDAQAKLQSGGNLMNEQARGQLEREIEKMQRELQFAQQDATDDINQLTQELQTEFGQKIGPILEAIANEKGLHLVFAAPANLAWAHPGLDVSDDVVKRLNAKPAPPKK